MAPNLKRLLNSHDAPVGADDTTRELFRLINENFRDEQEGIKIADFSTIIQYGKKSGQSLYDHVMGLVYTLHQLLPIIALPQQEDADAERRVLYVAAILHDMNKFAEKDPAGYHAFATLVPKDKVAAAIEARRFPLFFPAYEQYLEDIAHLIQSHTEANTVGGGGIMRSATRYGLGQDRLESLRHIMQALDVLTLSSTLQEHKHKVTFLYHLNAFLAQRGRAEQYEFRTHQLVEQRGLLTNILQNALAQHLATLGWLPFLLYPDGVVYLVRKGSELTLSIEEVAIMVKQKLDSLTLADPDTLIEQTAQGIKFKPDALKSGLAPGVLWHAVRNVIARRKFKREELDAKARERTAEALRKSPRRDPAQTEALNARLADLTTPLISATDAQMRAAELLRTAYIMLNTYAPQLDNAWARLYRLAELPEEDDWFYECFDARYDRPYVLAGALHLTEDEVQARIVQDMPEALPTQSAAASAADPVWVDYLSRYLLLDDRPISGTGRWEAHLANYVANNHEQCVHCSAPFLTNPWVAGDLRSEDLKVQAFSNRLAGGGSEPKKNVCPMCRMQFLVEKLNYAEVRGESQLYLHFFPYNFMPKARADALNAELLAIRVTDEAVAALHIDAEDALREVDAKRPIRLNYETTTKLGKPHPYGMYCPQFSESVGGMITLPINGAGDNDSERYAYVLSDALVWARWLDMKVIISKNATPPLPSDNLPDVYLDMVPLAFSGLLPGQAYGYRDGNAPDSTSFPLAYINGASSVAANAPHLTLMGAIINLYQAKGLVGSGMSQQDTLLKLIRAMNDGPLGVFHVADREMEKADLSAFNGRAALPYLTQLSLYVAHYSGGNEMTQQTHQVLESMAQIAWQNYLRGTSLKRSALLYALSEIFNHMGLISPQLGVDTIRAATCREMFDHLDRISDQGRGRTAQDAVEKFVNLWYEGIVGGVYGGNYQRVLQDEKLLKSAYLFYLQGQIPSKKKDDGEPENAETETPSEAQ
jgi:CRISPR-associated protein Csc3